jgi:hypothetical protein
MMGRLKNDQGQLVFARARPGACPWYPGGKVAAFRDVACQMRQRRAERAE